MGSSPRQDGPLDEFQRARVGPPPRPRRLGLGPWQRCPAAAAQRGERRLEPFDAELARETYLTAWFACRPSRATAPRVTSAEICRAVRALPRAWGCRALIDLLLDGLALLTTEGLAAAAPTLQRAAKALADMPDEDVLRWG